MSKDLENENLKNGDELELKYEASQNGRASSPAAAPSSTPPARTTAPETPDTPSRTPRTSAEALPDTPPRTPDQSSSYDAEEIKLLALQNSLIGNFDNDGKYQIPNLQRIELINLDKVVQESNTSEILASAIIAGKALNFKISLANGENNTRSATLNLVEDVKIANTTLYTLSTELAKFSETNTPNFLFNARQKFHIHSKDENTGIGSWKDYNTPPINLVGELAFKQAELEMIAKDREKIDGKYIAAMLAALKTTKAGQAVVAEFVKEVQKNEYKNLTTTRLMVYRQILDALATDAKNKKILDQTQIDAINTAKTDYVIAGSAIITASRSAKEKAEMAGAAPLKTAPAKSAGGGGGKSKSGGGKSGGKSKGGGGGKSGGGGGGGKSKKKGGKDKKDDKKKPTLIDLALLNSLSSGAKAQEVESTKGGAGAVAAATGAAVAKHANKRQHKTSTKDPKIKKEIDPSALSNEINGILHDTKVHGAGFESNKEGGYTPKYSVKSTLKIEIHTKTTYKEL